ncbi:hypothetical protein J4423_01970 [Candidatus Pacearchaeota archaeon]|nr:hypothetical protein [Candidatus Pacearchaeota archaeon]
MPFKDIQKRREYRREWYKNNQRSEINHVKKRKFEIKLWYVNQKKNLSCINCKESHPAVIDFHHKMGFKKENEISFMVANGYSIPIIEKEIEKCIVLCANCHRKEHYQNNKL